MGKRVHISGVCGMGTAGLAAIFAEAGFIVSGSDKAFNPPMSDFLKELKIELKTGYTAENCQPLPDLFVIGNVISSDNPEAKCAEESGKKIYSMPQALGQLFLKDRQSLVVCGTHGKTTSSGLLAYLLDRLHRNPGFLVGGIVQNFSRSARLGSGDYFVVEGDEYSSAYFDRQAKFHHYCAKGLLLTSIEFDHADLYQDQQQINQQFSSLLLALDDSVPKVICSDYPASRELIEEQQFKRVISYGLNDSQNRPSDFSFNQEASSFTLLREGKAKERFTVPLLGRHNLLNFLGCTLLLEAFGFSLAEINNAVKGFSGIKRRQELIFAKEGLRLYDDFAHHPTAVKETLLAFKEAMPEKKLWAIFEPRTNTSRKNIFQKEYETAFSPADHLVISEIFDKEKIPENERLNTERIVKMMIDQGKRADFAENSQKILEIVQQEVTKDDLLLLFSAGTFDNLKDKLAKLLAQKFS